MKIQYRSSMYIIKLLFYLSNLVLYILYLYPGSIIGFLLYGDKRLQPQITHDFLVSSNHVYVFFVVSILGLISFKSNLRKILFYLIFISIILELLHIIIPERGFQISDLFGNIVGVIISLLFFKLIKGKIK